MTTTTPEPNTARYAVLTSGGDAPGMNAAIRSATMFLRTQGDVLGVQHGYAGLIDGDFVPLEPERVAPIIREGGTILGSARSRDFMTVAGRDRARRQLAQAGVTGLVVIGGNGSLTGAAALTDPAELGEQILRVVGVPASIDNDIGLTSMAIGVDTAMNTITEACDKISDTASAHDRAFLVEVMGRDCGYLAMTSAVASAADCVLFREAGKDESAMVETIAKAVVKARHRPPSLRRVLAVVAEGSELDIKSLKTAVDDKLVQLLGAEAPPVETRATVLGHVVRGGRPTAFDRLLGSRLGHVAARLLLSGATRKMAGWMLPTAPPEGIAERAEWDPYVWIVSLSAALQATASLLDGSSPIVQWRKRIFEQIEDVIAW